MGAVFGKWPFLFFIFLTAGLHQTQGSEKVFWTVFKNSPDSKIQSANLDGTNTQDIVTGLDGSWPVDIDYINRKIYWGDVNNNVIQRSNWDGTNKETILGGIMYDGPGGLAVDSVHQELYWSDYIYDRIYKTNLKTGATVTLVQGLDAPFGIDLDLDAGKMYWADAGTGKIQRANLNGSDMEDLVTGLPNPRDIALDLKNGKMIWPDLANGIYQADLDGSDCKILFPDMDISSHAVAIDAVNGTFFFTSNLGISRADLDGSNLQVGIVPFNDQYGIAVTPEPATVSLLTLGGLALLKRRKV